MSKKFLENLKKYVITILVYITITFIFSLINPEKLYWQHDIFQNKNFINEFNVYYGIVIILAFIAIFIIYKESKSEKYDNKVDEKKAYIYTAVISSFFIVLFFSYIINGFVIDSRLFINKQFEKETIVKTYKIDLFTNEVLYINLMNGGYERVEIDSTKYKNIHIKDSIAIIKSKIGIFEIPYDHKLIEIK